jgi:hypothetical protein
MAYRCTTCGELHFDLPSVGADQPDPWWAVQEDGTDHRIELTTDTCVIDDDYFIRGVLQLPIIGHDETFDFGVWVSQKRENFLTYLDHFESAEIGPFFGWLCTRITYYPDDTMFLKAMAHFRGGGQRPTIELEPTDHPLALDQRNGISMDRAWQIVHHYDQSISPNEP